MEEMSSIMDFGSMGPNTDWAIIFTVLMSITMESGKTTKSKAMAFLASGVGLTTVSGLVTERQAGAISN